MTITELKKQIKAADEARREAASAWRKDPDVRKAEDALMRARDRAQKASFPKAKDCERRLAALYAQLRAMEEARAVKVPEKVEKFFNQLRTGVDWGGDFRFHWLSDDERFVIWSIGGSRVWNGIGMEPVYHGVKHVLSDISKVNRRHGLDVYRDTLLREVTGRRYSKELYDDFQADILEIKGRERVEIGTGRG